MPKIREINNDWSIVYRINATSVAHHVYLFLAAPVFKLCQLGALRVLLLYGPLWSRGYYDGNEFQRDKTYVVDKVPRYVEAF